MTIYTAITGGRDKPRDDILCFNEYAEFNRQVLNAKIYKILPFQFIDDDISVWVDGNVFLKTDQKVLEDLLGDNDIAVWKHEWRKTVIEEVKAVQYFYPKLWLDAQRYWSLLDDRKFEDKEGLGYCGILIRRHNDKVKEFCNMWWSEITAHCSRDQLSFPYVKSVIQNIKIKMIEDPRKEQLFEFKKHV